MNQQFRLGTVGITYSCSASAKGSGLSTAIEGLTTIPSDTFNS